MRRRWAIYLVTGIVFGVFDFVYLDLLYKVPWQQVLGDGPAGRWLVFLVLNLGLWLVPVVPIAISESRRTRSTLRPALASLAVWCAAIVGYYFANAAYLAFWGLPSRPELHIANRASAYYWHNWASVLRGDILGGIMEWMVVAVVGGAIFGFLISTIYLRRFAPTTTGAGLIIRRNP